MIVELDKPQRTGKTAPATHACTGDASSELVREYLAWQDEQRQYATRRHEQNRSRVLLVLRQAGAGQR